MMEEMKLNDDLSGLTLVLGMLEDWLSPMLSLRQYDSNPWMRRRNS